MHFLGHVVPAGFKSDGASVPVIFTWIFKATWKYFVAAILHDWALKAIDPETGKKLFSRKKADEMFCDGMKALDVPNWIVKPFYLAVRFNSILKGDK